MCKYIDFFYDMRIKRKKVRRMSRFLRVFAVIFSLFFVGNAFAAGYTCASYKKYTSCNAGYYLTGTAVGNSCAACPSGWTSAGGTTVGMAASCFKDITLNKNGFSTTIAAGAGTGCKVQANATGTNPATLRVYYNTACTLPTISSTTSGAYVYYNWSKNTANIAASSVTTIAATTTAPTDTYYIRKQSCAANYYKNNSTTCNACPSTYPTSSAGTNGADRCFAACAVGTRKTTVSQVGCSTTAGGWMTAAHRVYNGNVSPEILAPYPYNTNTSTVQTYHNALIATTTGAPRQSFTGTMPAGHSVMGASGYITAYGARIINIDSGSFGDMELIEFNVIPQGSALTGNTSTAPYSGAYNPELSVIHGAEDLIFFELNATDGNYSTASAIPPMDSLEYEFGGAANIAFVQVTFANNDDSNAYEIQLDITGNGDWVSITGNQTTPTDTYMVTFDSNSGAWQTRILPAIAWVPCSAGKYRGGLNSNWYLIANQATCVNVTAGYWNNGGGTNATGAVISGKSGGTIAAGRWGTAGATTAQGSGAVNAGYYSTGGGTSATPTAAGDGCISSKACGPVTAGCYTTSTGSTTACPNTCPGLYVNSAAGSDSINDCYITTTAGKYMAAATDTAQTTCPATQYCESETLYYPNVSVLNNGGWNDCPAITSSTTMSTYPSEWGTVSNVTANMNTWSTGQTSISNCKAYYSVTNTMGHFQIDSVQYNTSNNKYDDIQSTRYYNSVNPGYYLKNRYSDDYCTWGEVMLYQDAVACPAGSYCPGFNSMPSCDSGNYTELDEIGKNSCTTDTTYYTSSAEKSGSINSCYLTLGTGKFVETAKADQKTCTAGGYCDKAGSKIYYDSTGGRTACSAGTYNSNSGSTASSACQSCPAGYYGSSTGLTTSTCSGTIAAGYWGTAGAKSNTGSGTVNGGYYSTGGGTSATPTANGNGCVGTGNTCGKLSAEYYSNGGSTTNGATCVSGKVCGTCNTNYRANTSTGKTAATQCQTSCAPGTAVLSANAACATVTGNRYKTGTALVNYGSTSPTATDVTSDWNAGTVYSCLSNYTISGTAASNHDARTDCTISCAPGTQIASANATSCTTPTGTTWYTDTTHSVSAGSSSGSNVKTCNTSYATANTATATDHDNANDCKTTCAAGTWVASAGAACGDVGNGYYTTASQTISQGSIGSRSQCSALNAFYTNSDNGRNATADCYGYATATKYVAEAGKGAVTCSGGYCPGDNTTKIYYASGNGATTGGRSTLSNWTCPSGADAASDCYRGVTLNKNSMSGTLTLPSSSGCRSIGSATGTTSDTVYVYYNTACKLPTTALSATATGTTYTGTGTWATSSTASSGFVNSITLTDTSSTTPVRYAGKMYTCSAGYHLPANGTACSSCVAGNWCAGISNKYYSTSAQGLLSCSGNLGTGYTSAGGTGDTANTKCYLPVSAGYIRSGTSGTTTAACDAGKYKTAHNAYYGSSYSCSNVNAGYWNNGGGTNATGGVISGKSGGTIAAGRWGAAGATSDQGSGAVNAGYYSTGGGTSATPTAAGTGCLSSKACGKVTAGCYTTSTGSTVACPNTCPGDMTSDAGSDAKTDCKITCEAGNYLAKSGDTCATCTTGHYCANDGTYYFNTSNDQGITAAADGKYVAGTGATTDVACAQGSYSEKSSASTKCIACPAGRTTSGTGTKYNATANTACSVTCSNATGAYAWANPSWSANSVTNLCTVSTCSSSYYKNGNACTLCSTLADGFYPNSSNGNASGTSACYTNSIIGKYVASKNAPSATNCPNWTYKSSHAVNYGETSSCTDCAATPSALSGVSWTKASGTGWDSYSDCVVTQTPANCASGTTSRTQTNATTWGDVTLVSTLKSKDGYFASTTAKVCSAAGDGYYAKAGATGQTACATGSYSTKSSASSTCTACPKGRTTSGTGTKYNATANTACSVTCSNANGVYSWADPSWSANSVANLCTVSACNADTYYTEKTATGYKNTCTTCGANSGNDANHTMSKCICDLGHTIDGKLGSSNTSTSGCTRISGIPCAVGQYLPAQATTCEDCDAGYYCPAEPKDYSFQDYIQGRIECALGTYQPNKKQTSCLIADAGYYVPETAQTQQTACTGATYQEATGKAYCDTCYEAKAYPGSKLGYYYDTTGIHFTKEGCHATIVNPTINNGTVSEVICYLDENNDYGTANALRGSWGCETKTTNLTCDGGYYTTKSGQFAYRSLAELAANTCTSVGSGYYSTDGTLTRTECATGLVTCGAGKCANEAADCGRKLHAGDQTIYLRSAARTSPALNVKIGNQTFFGALSTAYSSKLKVKKDNTTYSVVNDYQ